MRYFPYIFLALAFIVSISGYVVQGTDAHLLVILAAGLALVNLIIFDTSDYRIRKKRQRKSDDSDAADEVPWASEKPTGEDRPMEARIIDYLKSQNGYSATFVSLSLHCTEMFAGEDELFWNTLQSLQRQGKVVRVSGPTRDDYSRWLLAEDISCED